MDIEIIREFTELAKQLNFTETSRILNMSQPTLSKHISSLEKDLKLPLFDRCGSSLRLTRAGMELLPFAYKIIEAENKFYSKVKQMRMTPLPRLSVGGMVDEEMVTEVISYMLLTLSCKYGTNFLEVKPSKHRLPQETLRAGALDIAFDYYLNGDQDEEIDAVPVGELLLFALVDRNHRFANRESISIEDLRNDTFIKIEGSHISDAWRFIEACCIRHHFTPNTQQYYSMRLTDLITVAANLDNNVLILGLNFFKRLGVAVSPFCKTLPISDVDAVLPVAALYRSDNENPIIAEAIAAIGEARTKNNPT